MTPFRCLFLVGLCTVSTAVGASTTKPAGKLLPWGDQGDGTFINPVLYADYSDPDVIRVGEDFYLIASDFHFMGIQILHSRDLVNWRLIGRVFDRLEIDPKYDNMTGYAEGTWAPTLRYRDGKFLIYVCTPKDGLLRWSASAPQGPWELLVMKRAVGWEDPCPFWDDDGRAYLVRGAVGAGPLILHRMSSDGAQLLDDGVEIYRGPVAEGPKLFKRDGWYYISLPEGGVEAGGQTVLRSRSITGPYERKEVLPYGSPHQGAIVDLDSGESWFMAFKSTGHFGRVCHLMPVRWNADGWPTFGDAGLPVWRSRKPATAHRSQPGLPQTSDSFDGTTLSAQWQWNHNPVDPSWSLDARKGWLRLHALPAPELPVARNTLTQKVWAPAGTFTAKLDTAAMTEGQRAGVGFMGGAVFIPLGVTVRSDRRVLYWPQNGELEIHGTEIWLRARYVGQQARLSYSTDGIRFLDTGFVGNLRAGHWKGARVILFCYGEKGGYVDIDDVQYVVGSAGE
jgi:beta-xylosidase